MQNSNSSAGTTDDSSIQPIVNSSADIEANPMLAEVPEYVMCSAIWYGDLETQNLLPFNKANGIVLCGWRHGNIISQMKALTDLRTVKNGMASVGEYEQGFLTNKNRFVSREEGGQIAFKAGQTKELKTYLFSEDVW